MSFDFSHWNTQPNRPKNFDMPLAVPKRKKMATGAGAGRKQVGALQLQLCGSDRRFVHEVDVGFSLQLFSGVTYLSLF